ncbi:hypothetical protein ABZ897_35560 [Nonomuraea sp. NPDC046802]|uniref:hypothetical protein n=1 Tax=Nonomuraea sp. NPDC046802 TaxID=3154919 RepID=UPI0033D4F6FD
MSVFAASLVAGVIAISTPAGAATASSHDVGAPGQVGQMASDPVGPFGSEAACTFARRFDDWYKGTSSCFWIETHPPGYRLWYYVRYL